jgi:hypothetical protein
VGSDLEPNHTSETNTPVKVHGHSTVAESISGKGSEPEAESEVAQSVRDTFMDERAHESFPLGSVLSLILLEVH